MRCMTQETVPDYVDSTLVRLDWHADCLQVIEFINTFGDKLKESLQGGGEETTDHSVDCDESYGTILSSLESFRLGLENKNDKCKKETVQLAQFLLKCSINNTNFSKLNNFFQDSEMPAANNPEQQSNGGDQLTVKAEPDGIASSDSNLETGNTRRDVL